MLHKSSKNFVSISELFEDGSSLIESTENHSSQTDSNDPQGSGK